MLTDDIVENAWTRAQGRCECAERSHHHPSRCGKPLDWAQRGKATHAAAWEALQNGPKTLGGWEAVNQTRILCWACYATTTGSRSQGRQA